LHDSPESLKYDIRIYAPREEGEFAMPSTSIEDAQAHLAAWIAQLRPGEELVIIEKDHPIARLVAEPIASLEPRQSDSAKGNMTVNEDDLDDTIAAQVESALEAGWSDPLMDEYNDYDSHRGRP
jgi:antitoxin (DNA-binding transcriptional repressor) of toxin-antitoxin stability system